MRAMSWLGPFEPRHGVNRYDGVRLGYNWFLFVFILVLSFVYSYTLP
jgi:hypothetical protein